MPQTPANNPSETLSGDTDSIGRRIYRLTGIKGVWFRTDETPTPKQKNATLFDVGSASTTRSNTPIVDPFADERAAINNSYASSSSIQQNSEIRHRQPVESRIVDHEYDNNDIWREVLQQKGENLIKELINNTQNVENLSNPDSTDVYSDVGTDNTPDLISDSSSSVDKKT